MSKSSDELNLPWSHIQDALFSWLREEVGGLTAQHERIVLVLDMLGLETHVTAPPRGRGRPPEDRRAIARAFAAFAAEGLADTIHARWSATVSMAASSATSPATPPPSRAAKSRRHLPKSRPGARRPAGRRRAKPPVANAPTA